MSQPEDTDTVVTLTATLSKGSATDTKEFMLTVKRTYPFQCTGGMASMERSATAGVTKCILCDPTHTLVNEACVNYPYECAQGMASTDRSLTEGVTKCVMCNAGYSLVNEDCINYPYQCMNGMAVSERSLTEGVTKCESCDTHYVLEGEECVAGYRYTCENGMPQDGITQIQGEVKCKFCDSGYILDPSDMSCRPAGEGTQASPYLILTYEGLKGMRNNLTAHYRLGANIDASPSWSEGANGCAAYEGDGELPASSPCTGWVPVGDDPDPFDSNTTTQFTGSLDGGGYTISNLYVYMKRTSGHAYGGLFGYTGTGAEIKNVGLTDVYVHVSNTGTTTNGGGLVAWNIGTITNSYATGSVTFSSSGETNAGGLVGFNRARIVNSYAASSVTFSSQPSPSFNGGLVGNNFGAISNSYATGSVTFSSSLSHSGGLVGYNSGGSITNSYATGSVGCGGTCPNPIFGGLVGENRSGGTITGTNYFVDDQGGTNGVGLGTCAMGAVCQRRTFVELGALTSVTGWEASDWDFDTATQLPRLKYTEVAAYCTDSSYTTKATCEANSGLWLAEGAECEAITLNTAANDGDANMPDCGDVIPGQVSPKGSPVNPHIITTYAELKTMRNDLSAHYKLGGNIDASASWEEGAENCDAYTGNGELPTGTPCTGWVPVGDATTRFTGSLDGGGYTISNLYVYVKVTSGDAYGGLFGYAGGRAEIRNLGLTDVYVNVSASATSLAGALVGVNIGSIMNSHSTGEVTASSTTSTAYGGGLVGQNSSGSITNSYATADITAESAANQNVHGGGLVGENFSKGTISNSHATGDVKVSSLGSTHGGGLVGTNYSTDHSGIITNSYATGDVEATSTSGTPYGGGLVGWTSGTISNSYATGDVEATSTSGESRGGGLAGENNNGTITNSYATGNVEAESTSGNSLGGGLVGWTIGTITNSYATGDVTVTVTGSSFSGFGGGLAGFSFGSITNSYATGDVRASSPNNVHGGGLVGQSLSTIMNSYARGDVTTSSTSGSSFSGGLVGAMNSGTITNSYATGSVTVLSGLGSSNGGLVGWAGGTVTGTNYFVHNGAGADDDDGVGNNGTCANTVCQQRTLAQLAALTSVTGWAASDWHFSVTTHLPRLKYAEVAAYCTDSSKTTQAACEAPNSANNNNPFGVWLAEGAECEAITPPASNTSANDGNPNTPDCGDVLPWPELGFASGSGTSGDPYIIMSYEELKLMRRGISHRTKHYDLGLSRLHYKLGANIDARASWGEGASGCAAYTGNGELPSGTPCTGWVPVGDNSSYNDATRFTGSFDGGGHTISNLYVYVKLTSGNGFGGLFGYAGNGAEIKNLGLTDVYVNVFSYSSYGGGLVGYSYRGSIMNSYATGNVEVDSSYDSYGGGLVGYSYRGSIMNSYATGNVEVDSTGSSSSISYGGGLVGLMEYRDIIINSYATGNVEVDSTGYSSSGGGLVGLLRNNGAIIINSYATGNVEVSSSTSSSSSFGGGLVGVGLSYDGTIMNSYATGNVEVSSSSSLSSGYNDGTVYGGYGGGLVGFSVGTIMNSYATGNVEVDSSYDSYGGGLVGFSYDRTTISNSYATGNVEVSSSATGTDSTASPYGGGLVGYMYDGTTTISNSYAAGNVGCKAGGTCTNPKFGGLVGENQEEVGRTRDGVTTTITGTITGTNYFVYNGMGTADDDGVHTGGCAMGATCAPANGTTAALRLTWMRDTLNEATAFTTQAGTSPAYTAWDAASWADMNKVGGFPKLKYVEVDAFCSSSSYTTKATCEAGYQTWLAEGAECEVITPSSDNTAANNGDAKIPDCGDVIPGQ